MLCLPLRCADDNGVADAAVCWPQLEYMSTSTISGIHPSGTIVVRAKTEIAAESIFPCLGVYEKRRSQTARFCPCSVSPISSDVVINGSPSINPYSVSLVPCTGGVSGREHRVDIGCAGWSFFPYCREPPPSLSLSTVGICTRTPDNWKELDLYRPLVEGFGLDVDRLQCHACDSGSGSGVDGRLALPLSVIVFKRDVEAGEEILVAFNQFDGIGRSWAYATPSPFLRVSSAFTLLSLSASVQVLRRILAGQASLAITESYVKLLEDTSGTDARTTERINIVILNLVKAVRYFHENDGKISTLPFVVPFMCPSIVHRIPSNSTAVRPLKRPKSSTASDPVSVPAAAATTTATPIVPLFAASFRIPQSFIPPL